MALAVKAGRGNLVRLGGGSKRGETSLPLPALPLEQVGLAEEGKLVCWKGDSLETKPFLPSSAKFLRHSALSPVGLTELDVGRGFEAV